MNEKFFTVRDTVKIGEKVYRPCCSYNLKDLQQFADVDALSAKGTIRIHDHYVFFQNGKPIDQKQATSFAMENKKERSKKHKKDVDTTAVNV